MAQNFFPQRPEARPMIYAYEDKNPQYKGLLKVGYTSVDVQKRVAQQYPTLSPLGTPYRIVLEESAMRSDGSSFSDHDVHRLLRKQGFENPNGEWFRCTVRQVRSAILSVRNRTEMEERRSESFAMHPEQSEAVEKTADYFERSRTEDSEKIPHFLWNCKMRFGKTFATYQLARRMGWRRILVLTFKPAVQSAWEEDLASHTDFKGWQFISRSTELTINEADQSRPIVCF